MAAPTVMAGAPSPSRRVATPLQSSLQPPRRWLCGPVAPALAVALTLAALVVLRRALPAAPNGSGGSGRLRAGPAATAAILGDGAVITVTGSAPAPDAGTSLTELPSILLLTPLKNGVGHLDRYFANIRSLRYPRHRLSLALMDSDSDDVPDDALLAKVRAQVASGFLPPAVLSGSNSKPAESDDGGGAEAAPDAKGRRKAGTGFRPSATLFRLLAELPALAADGMASVTVFQHNFGFNLQRQSRHGQSVQLQRRRVLALSRNHLLITALREQDWVLWVDSDLYSYQPDVIQQLLASGKRIVVPNAVLGAGGRSFDLNSWRVGPEQAEEAGLSLGNDATAADVAAYHDLVHKKLVKEGTPHELLLEGYGKTGHVYLDKLRKEGEVVRLDGVGGAMLLVDAELHRHGLVFPPFVYRHRIETEGLSMMALDMGVLSWGMPNVEVIHH